VVIFSVDALKTTKSDSDKNPDNGLMNNNCAVIVNYDRTGTNSYSMKTSVLENPSIAHSDI
jgi:hypothetical protein